MTSAGGSGGNDERERELSAPVPSEAVEQWPSSAAGTETSARVVAGGEDGPVVTDVSLPWAGVGHSARAGNVAAGRMGGALGSSVWVWAMRALARVNGLYDGLLGDFSEVADSLVGLDGITDTLSWGALATAIVIAEEVPSIFGSAGDLNNSSVTKCI